MRRAILLSLLPLTLAACAPTPSPAPGEPTQMGHGMTVVTATVTYRERILLTPGHVLMVTIEDVTRADAPALILGEHRETLDGRAPPYRTTVGFPSSLIDQRHTYIVRAEIRDPSGALRFTTDTRHTVLTNNTPADADIVLVAVR
ncbi:MAG: YbaY family lipoprotein [Brevundimonas sp.]